MNRIIHFEIHAENPVQAAAFYTSVFGWKIEKWAQADYWLIKTGEDGTPGINGGITKRQGGLPVDGGPVNAYVCTVDVPSLEDALAKVAQAGGKNALPKMPIPGMGWLAYCKDIEGNIFGLMQADPQAK